MVGHRGGGIGHRLGEGVLIRMLIPAFITVIARPAGMDEGFARTGGAADGKLLKRPTISAHRVTFEVGEEEHRIVIEQVFAD